MSQILSGEIAIVTGGSSGIGFAIARGLGAAGASVVLAGRNEARGRDAVEALRLEGTSPAFVSTDVSAEGDVEALVAETCRRFGPPSLLVNNAGPAAEDFGFGPIDKLSGATLMRTIEIGMLGAFLCCRYALPHMMTARRGAILNISAIAATRALPYMGAYAMAKAGVEALGRQVANDYAPYGIRSNNLVVGTVRPVAGDISTLPAAFDHATIDRAIGPTTMLGRVGTYAEAAAAAIFLLSPESRYITGANVPVEGGALSKLQYPDYTQNMPDPS